MTPKIIHQIVGNEPNELVLQCLRSVRALEEQGYEVIYWDDDNLREFVKEEFPFALEALINARNHAEAADIGRYLVVYKMGGYYFDWDIEINSIAKFIGLAEKNENGYLLIDPVNGTFAAEHFSACAREQYLLKIVEDIVHTYEREERELMATPQYSGPYRMKTALKRYKKTAQTIIPVKEVFEYDYAEIKQVIDFDFTNDKAMIHYWMHSWIPLAKRLNP